MPHECEQREELGRIKEFMLSIKGFKTLMGSVILTIVLQVVAFSYLWGGLTQTVKYNSVQLWDKVTPAVQENTRNIDKILERLQVIKMIGIIGEKGEQGFTGKKGDKGDKGDSYK